LISEALLTRRNTIVDSQFPASLVTTSNMSNAVPFFCRYIWNFPPSPCTPYVTYKQVETGASISSDSCFSATSFDILTLLVVVPVEYDDTEITAHTRRDVQQLYSRPICCIFEIQTMKPFIVPEITFKGYSRSLHMALFNSQHHFLLVPSLQ